MDKPVLYLIPSPLGDVAPDRVLTRDGMETVLTLTDFVVEEIRTARRYLSKLGASVPSLQFATLNEHTDPSEVSALLEPLRRGRSLGLISEAGLPAVADPGALLVAAAHREGFTVCPLVGPSSLMMALMSSGQNGQSFAFNGYLPVKPQERNRRIKDLERRSRTEGQAQLFIETPYRNQALFEAFLETCAEDTLLTLAVDLTLPDAYICTRTVGQWKKQLPPEDTLHKRPCVFIIGYGMVI